MCEKLCNICSNYNCTKADEKFETDIFCGLIHQQFNLRRIVNNTEDNPLYIYAATRFPVLDINGIPQDPIFPSGTVIARNVSGSGSIRYTVYGDSELEEETSLVVPPNSEAAITASDIRSVSVFAIDTLDPIRVLFFFDIIIPADSYSQQDPT